MISPFKLLKTEQEVKELEKNVQAMNPTNWRTTLSGTLAAAIQLAKLWVPPNKQMYVDATSTFLVAVGLYHAADKQNQ